MIEYSDDLKFWFSLTDLIRVGGITLEQHKKIADLVLTEKPNLVLETGVCTGSSTVVILNCLKQLNNGTLYSIDDMSLLKKFTSCYVIEDLRDRWRFIKEKSRNYLSSLEDDFRIDMFLHDSEHTFKNMEFELDWAYRHISQNCYILCHDTHNNNAWNNFYDKAKDDIVDSFKIGSLCGARIKK